MMRRFRVRWAGWILLILLVVGSTGYAGWYLLFRQERVAFASDVDHFKYGSVGVEAASGLPYLLWAALPRVFPDKLGGGRDYAGFGFLWDAGKPTPIGLPMQTVGFPRVGINCGLCHIGSVREHEGDVPRLLIGAPNSTLDLQRYFRFLFACADDPRFDAATLLPAMESIQPMSLVQRLLYRFVIIPQVRSAIQTQHKELWWMDTAPDWGPGRVDPFNPAKVQLLHQPYDGTIGAARMVPLWNWAQRHGFGLHRDGLNTSLTEIFLNSGIGNGATNRTIDLPSLERLQTWIETLAPPPYPFAVDRALAVRGAPIFAAHCGACHAFGGEKTGEPIPIERVGTDRARFDSWTVKARDGFNGLDAYDWHYSHFRKTSGYMAQALDSVWARAPYLHNGSVPTLRDLLTDPAARPVRFYSGFDVYDQVKVGFISDGPGAAARGRLFDTSLTGNGNRGHSFGVSLSETDKKALLEYLKTL